MSEVAGSGPDGASGDWRQDANWPDVDVVMPVRNEAAHLRDALAAVRKQSYSGRVRVIMAIGPSHDSTADVAAALAADDADLTIVDNPHGITPAALNRAIEAGSAPVVVRVDGHSQLCDGYIERAVATLRRTGAVNVGGRQVPIPTTPFEEAVASATTSRLGTGGASYRVGGAEADVDTVYLGVFDRSAIEAVGLFDERLLRNQDYELNIRLRAAGGRIVFDPELWVGYTPRSSWTALARQYYEYGQWKAVVMRMHPSATKLRQIVPPLAIGGVVASLIGVRRRSALAFVPIGYALLVALEVRRNLRAAPVVMCIHLAWSVGWYVGMIESLGQNRGGRPSFVSRHTVRHAMGRRSTDSRQPDRHPRT